MFNYRKKGLIAISVFVCIVLSFSIAVVLRYYDDYNNRLESRIIELSRESFQSNDGLNSQPLSEKDLNQKFLEPLREASNIRHEDKVVEQNRQFHSYFVVHQALVGQYYATGDEKILETIIELQQYLQREYPDIYDSFTKNSPEVFVWE